MTREEMGALDTIRDHFNTVANEDLQTDEPVYDPGPTAPVIQFPGLKERPLSPIG